MRFPIGIFKVRSRSMEPYLKDGDYIITSSWKRGLKENDVVVIRHPSKPMRIVKRIKWINGEKVFAVGDNEKESEDSRVLGTFDISSVVGKVLFAV